jgi:hypothetical protein
MADGEPSRGSRIVLGVVVVAAPAVVTCVLLATLFDATFFDYFPLVSDEIAYQRQIAAFVKAGFGGGYFTAYERPAPFAASHFSVHGPAFPVIYGLLGKVLGWHLYSGPIFNLGVLAGATAAFLVLGRLSRSQIAAAGAVILTSWWVLLMAPITMQESLNQAVMIVVAGLAARLLHPDTRRHGWILRAGLGLLVVASVLRPTNWIVAVPLVLVGMPRQGRLRKGLAALGAAIAIPAFWLIWRYVSAPIPGLAIDWAPATGSGAAPAIVAYFFDHLRDNVADIFDMRRLLEAPFFQHIMFESAAAALGSALLVARARHQMSKVDLFNLLALGLALVAFLGFYFDSEASISRVTAPFVLLSLLLLVATRSRPWMVAAAIAANLLVAPSFLATYRAWRVDLFRHDDARYQSFRAQVAPWLSFDPGRSAWCNTLLTTTYEREIVGVPDGIGLSLGRPSSAVAAPIKSGYVLLTADSAEDVHLKARLQHLTTTALGELYANRDATCE